MLLIPDEHIEQAANDEPPGSALYHPAAQRIQLVLPASKFEYLPAIQELHDEDPVVATYCPPLHNEHNILLKSAANKPALQKYAMLSPGQKAPIGQMMHAVPEAFIPVPSGHVDMQDVAPIPAVEQTVQVA